MKLGVDSIMENCEDCVTEYWNLEDYQSAACGQYEV